MACPACGSSTRPGLMLLDAVARPCHSWLVCRLWRRARAAKHQHWVQQGLAGCQVACDGAGSIWQPAHR